MPKRACAPLDEMSAGRLQDAAQEVGGEVSFFVQGYPFTTFGRFLPDGTPELPPMLPNGSPEVSRISWDLFWDVRVFGPAGDWHAWRDNSGDWQCGLLRIANEDEHVIVRGFVLWGETFVNHGDWTCRVETRGARVWIPTSCPKAAAPDAQLWVKLLANFDENGIAGIVDAAFHSIG